MGNVYTLHQQVVAAYNGGAFRCRTARDGHILTYAVIVAYLTRGLLASVLKVLRLGGDARTGEYLVVVAYTSPAVYGDTILENVVITYHRVLVYEAERAYLIIVAELRLGVNVC